MLKGLRKNQKWITLAIAIIFILGMAVMGISGLFVQKPYVGKIYGKKIEFQDYDRMLRQYISQYMQQNPGQEIDEQTNQRISDEFWQRFVQQKVMEKQIKRYHIKVTDDIVLNKMKNDPPAELYNSPDFQTNGVFDKDKYIDILYSNDSFAESIESYFRELLPYELLEAKIKSLANVTRDSARVEYILKNDKVTGQLIYFDYNNVPADSVSESDIIKYFDANKNKEYKKEASAKYKYVKFVLEPSEYDIQQAKEDIDNIYQNILDGDDFASLASSYSQDPGSAANGGDLGFFGKGAMVKEFEDTAFSMAVGQVSEPFKTNFGWHILKVTAKKNNDKGEPEVQASHILIPIKASESTKMHIREHAETLYDYASKDGLEKAANELELKVEETMEFEKTAQSIPALGRYPHLVKAAFKNRVGYLEKPLKIYDGSYIVVELSDKSSTHIQDYNNVKDAIRFKIEKERRMAKAAELAKEFIATVNEEDYFVQAKADGWKVVDFKDINHNSSISQIGLNKDLNKALLALEIGKMSQLIDTEKGAYIGIVNEKSEPNMDTWENEKEKLTQEYITRKENQHYSEWFRKVMEEADIEDLRYLYY